MVGLQARLGFGAIDAFGVDVVNFDLRLIFHARVAQGFVQGFIAVAQIGVFAHHGDMHLACGLGDFSDQFIPQA